MAKANRIAQLFVGVLLSAPGFADDTQSANSKLEPLPSELPAAQVWLAEFKSAYRSQLLHAISVPAYANEHLASVDFKDTSAFARIRGLRSVSLVTVAEPGRARLFLGVNAHGVLGLHFSAWRRPDAALEVLRMPYLAKNKPGS